MLYSSFPGQMNGERLLHVIPAHPIAEFAGYTILGLAYISWLILVYILSSFFPDYDNGIQITGAIISLAAGGYGFVWVRRYARETITFITDIRLVGFRVIHATKTVKQAIFWNDSATATVSVPNALWKLFSVGTIRIPAKSNPKNFTAIRHVDDPNAVASYINKIMELTPKGPSALQSLIPYEMLLKSRVRA